MKNEIAKKIAVQLDHLPLSDEPRVTYFLAEVRKIFEHEGSLAASLPTLEFYCNWALHTRLGNL